MKHWIVILGLMSAFGCEPRGRSTVADASPEADDQNSPIRLVVIDDGPLAEVIEREWRANTQGELTVQSLSRDEFDPAQATDTDVFIYPTNWLGTLVDAKVIRALPRSARPDTIDSDQEYDWNDVLPMVRREEIRWGLDPYAVSFGSPQLVLVYRQDLFELWNLEVPTTWREYREVLQKIGTRIEHARLAGDLADLEVSYEPLGEGWAARTLLARAAAYSRQRSQYSDLFHFASMEPLINRPPFVRALEEMIEGETGRSAASLELSPADVMQRMLDGQAALGLAWPSASIRASDTSAPPALSFAELPGSQHVYELSSSSWKTRPADEDRRVPLLGFDGRLGSIGRNANSPTAATNFLFWLTGREQGTRISPRSIHTTLFRKSQLSSAQEWMSPEIRSMASQYASVVSQAQTRPKWLTVPRIPGQDRYLRVLDEAVRRAIRQRQPPQSVLDEVAEEWSMITAEYGRDKQQQAYQRSLGLAK